MTNESLGEFTRTAATLVARNDRRGRRNALFANLRRAAARVGLVWSALAIAAFVLVILPINMRLA